MEAECLLLLTGTWGIRPSKNIESPAFSKTSSSPISYTHSPEIMNLNSKASVMTFSRLEPGCTSKRTHSNPADGNCLLKICWYIKPLAFSSFSMTVISSFRKTKKGLLCGSGKSLKKNAMSDSSAAMRENKTGNDGMVRPFSTREISPLLTPAFCAMSLMVNFFSLRICLILFPTIII